MDHNEFLKKLSEVCDWEYRQHQGQTNHNWRAETDDPPPEYIHIKQLRTPDCDLERGFHKNTIIKQYGWMRKKFLVERCPHCEVARTRHSDWFKINHISNIASQAYYKEFGGEEKAKKKIAVSKDSKGVMRIENGYQIEEGENFTISKILDK